MADMSDFPETGGGKPKSFWKRPEGVTGTIFLIALIAGAGFLLVNFLPALIALTSNILTLVLMLAVIGVILYMILDPKMRSLIGYMYKSVMRWMTSLFVTIDPIGILKNYVDDLQDNLRKMSKQIGEIRGQMRKLKNIVADNEKEINNSLLIAKKAREKGDEKHMLLSTRKAARLKDSNQKYNALLSKMTILSRVLTKMYQNSEILLEDTRDQVKLKEQERKAIRASHSAMKSAMNIITGNKDQRAMFDQAIEHIADDVANKVGEMERFMELSSDFMNSVDLQNGVFEEQGMKMLEEWEKKSTLMLMGGKEKTDDFLDLSSPQYQKEPKSEGSSNMDQLFE